MDVERERCVMKYLGKALKLNRDKQHAMMRALRHEDANLWREVKALLEIQCPAMDRLDQPLFKPSADGNRVPPFILNGVKLKKEIGRGGMGIVYLGRHEENGSVAVKILRNTFLTNDFRHRFENEWRILHHLKSPYVAKFQNSGLTPDHQPYFTMEYIEGLSVNGWIQAFGHSLTLRLSLFLRICEAVSYIHKKGVIHRDLKPENILVTHRKRPKLLDFGIATPMEKAGRERAQHPSFQARLLTPRYASPEHIEGLPTTPGSDIWSLGVLLFEILTGTHPYPIQETNQEETLRIICEDAPQKASLALKRDPPPNSVCTPEDLEGDLDQILMKTLTRDLKERYPCVESLMACIRRFVKKQRKRVKTFTCSALASLPSLRPLIPLQPLASTPFLAYDGRPSANGLGDPSSAQD